LEAVRAENQRLQKELGNSEAQKEELNQELAEVRSQLEQERADREKFQSEVSVLNAKLAAALEQNEKLAPIAIGVEVRSQLEQERADRQEVEAELSELKQNSARAATLFEKLTPDAAMILNQVRAKREKLKIGLDDLKVILKILASSAKKIEEET
jgi:multidrug resistance efflux pump